MKKSLIAAALAASAMVPMSAFAQAASAPAATAPAATAAPTVGAKVYDTAGAEVGTVEKVDGANAVVFTGTKRATLPGTAFAKNDKGLVIAMTQAQLNAAVTAAESKTAGAMDAALVADAPIKSKDGVAVGTVQKVEGDNVTVALTDGNPVTITKQYLTVGANNALTLTMNATEFKSAVTAATQSSATAPASADASANTTAKAGATPDATEN